MPKLQKQDVKVYKALVGEVKRQQDGMEMIASENYVSPAVLEALGSVFTNKYSEGYPGKRYYGGQTYTDVVESLAIERVKEIFSAEHVNVAAFRMSGQYDSLQRTFESRGYGSGNGLVARRAFIAWSPRNIGS